MVQEEKACISRKEINCSFFKSLLVLVVTDWKCCIWLRENIHFILSPYIICGENCSFQNSTKFEDMKLFTSIIFLVSYITLHLKESKSPLQLFIIFTQSKDYFTADLKIKKSFKKISSWFYLKHLATKNHY